MKPLTNIQLPSNLEDHLKQCCDNAGKQYKASPTTVSSCEAFDVTSLDKLILAIGRLSTLNPNVEVFFRGQRDDYGLADNGISELYPSIYRKLPKTHGSDKLDERFGILRKASCYLVEEINGLWECGKLVKDDRDKFDRELVQWAALQHYEVVGTPLLDLTQSVRIACWFAFEKNRVGESAPNPTVYVLGMPYLTGPITLDVANELYEMRLTGIMPPIVERPFFQEGFLAMSEFYQPKHGGIRACNFNQRLLGKFRLVGDETKWREAIGVIKKELVITSEATDYFAQIAKGIQRRLEGYEGRVHTPSHEKFATNVQSRSGTEMHILRLLNESGSLSLADVSERLGLSRQSVARILAGLVRQGLLVTVKEDKRVTQYALTERGSVVIA